MSMSPKSVPALVSFPDGLNVRLESKIDRLSERIGSLEGQLSSLLHAVACVYKQASICVQISQQSLAVQQVLNGQTHMLSSEWVRYQSLFYPHANFVVAGNGVAVHS